MPCKLLNIKKKLLINFNEIKKEKRKLKTIKYINSDLIHFEQKHNHIFKHKTQTHNQTQKTQTQI